MKIITFASKSPACMNISEKAMTDFQNGEIDSLYMEIYPSLLRYATRVLRDDHAFLAEDCVQEAIYEVYRRRKTFDTPLQMKSYLFTCIHNEMVSIFRKSNRESQYLEEREIIEESIIDQYVMQETLDKLYAAIDELPENLRQLFELSYEQGLKNVQIAKILQLSPETIKKRKAKLISTLRSQFKDDITMMFLLTIII